MNQAQNSPKILKKALKQADGPAFLKIPALRAAFASVLRTADEWAHLQKTEARVFSAPWGDFTPGEIVELASPPGAGKTEAVLEFLKRTFEKSGAAPVVWCEFSSELKNSGHLYPWAVLQKSVPLNQLICVEFPKDYQESDRVRLCVDLLKSQAFSGVICSMAFVEGLSFRKLQIATEQSQSFLILLNDQSACTSKWAIRHQFKVFRKDESIFFTNIKHTQEEVES